MRKVVGPLRSAWASRARKCLPQTSLGRAWPPRSDQPSPPYSAPRIGCQPGPGHPLAAVLHPHPPSQGERPARHHPASPQPHARAGGHLPGLLHTPGQVPSPTLQPPLGRGGASTSSSALWLPPPRPQAPPQVWEQGGSPDTRSFIAHLLSQALGRHRSPFILPPPQPPSPVTSWGECPGPEVHPARPQPTPKSCHPS